MADEQIQALRVRNDQICKELGLPKFQKDEQRQSRGMSNAEYYTAVKGESWKFRLINTIDQCMRYASTKDEFISLMESEGYQVRWTDGRKNITYTTPQGMRCRDDRLHESKYTKEVIEREFRIRAEIIHRGTKAAESASSYANAAYAAGHSHETGLERSAGGAHGPVLAGEHQQRPAGRSGGQRCGTGGPAAGAVPADGAAPHPGADGGAGTGCGLDSGGTETGWEEERAFYLAAQSLDRAIGLDLASPDPAGDYGWHGSLADDLVRLGRTLEGDPDAAPVRDATTMHQHADRKTLRRERAKKIAMGHKPDDHEDEIDMTMKGY